MGFTKQVITMENRRVLEWMGGGKGVEQRENNANAEQRWYCFMNILQHQHAAAANERTRDLLGLSMDENRRAPSTDGSDCRDSVCTVPDSDVVKVQRQQQQQQQQQQQKRGPRNKKRQNQHFRKRERENGKGFSKGEGSREGKRTNQPTKKKRGRVFGGKSSRGREGGQPTKRKRSH